MGRSVGEWIGALTFDSAPRMVKVDGSLAAGASARLGLPNERHFGLDLRQSSDGDLLVACAEIAGKPLTLRGSLRDQLFSGTAYLDGREGSFELRAIQVWDLAAYRAVIAPYDIGDGRRISMHVNADEWVGTPVMFYSEGNRFVRLYPDAFGNLISELAECFVLAPDGGGIVRLTPLVEVGGHQSLTVTRSSRWSEEMVSVQASGGRLAGSLMRPAGPGPHAAIVLIHGAAGGLRDKYRAFAEHYVAAGMAALIYDRRGWGESCGHRDPTWEEKADDAAAWIDWLAAHPATDSSRLGVWGFSNGSWVAPMVAVRRPEVAFVAVIGASGTTPIETEIHRRMFDLREQGVSDDQVAEIEQLWRIIYELLLTREVNPSSRVRYDELVDRMRNSEELRGLTVQEYAIQEPFLGALPPYRRYQEIVDDMPNRAVGASWLNDPADSYARMTIPVLYMVGENDSNLPAMMSANRVSQALQRAGNEQATVLLFPNTGHAMNLCHPSPVGMSDEEAGYRLHGHRFAGGFVDIVQAWASDRASLPH